MRSQCRCYLDLLLRYSNLKMVHFWQDFGQIWLKNSDVSKNSADKVWHLSILKTRYKGYTLLQNLKFLVLSVQVLILGRGAGGGGGIIVTPHKSNVHKKAPEI